MPSIYCSHSGMGLEVKRDENFFGREISFFHFFLCWGANLHRDSHLQLSPGDVTTEWKMISQMTERCNAFSLHISKTTTKLLKKNVQKQWKHCHFCHFPLPGDCKQHLDIYGSLLWHKAASTSQEHSTVTEFSKTRWWHWSQNYSQLKCFSPKFLPDVAPSKPITLASSASILLYFAKPFLPCSCCLQMVLEQVLFPFHSQRAWSVGKGMLLGKEPTDLLLTWRDCVWCINSGSNKAGRFLEFVIYCLHQILPAVINALFSIECKIIQCKI